MRNDECQEKNLHGNGIALVTSKDISPPRGHYSHAAVSNGVVYTAGILPIIPGSNRKMPSAFRDQVSQVLDNLQNVLQSAGSALNSVLSVQCFIVDLSNWSDFDVVFSNKFGLHKPARAVIPCASFGSPAMLEVMAIARVIPFMSQTKQ